MQKHRLLAAGLAVATGLALVPVRADACGCFIDSDSTVDQSAERIIYLIEDDRIAGETNTTAIIQIQYEGGREEFGWILPVPTLPEGVSVWDGAIFNDLDNVTAPTLWAPPPGGGGFSLACGAQSGVGSDLESGVQIWGGGEIGPFEYVILTGTSSTEVFNWMGMNGYQAPTGTGNILDDYIADGFYFVVLKLLPGADVDTIQPIGVTYKGDMPCVPLKLTGLGAVENMGLLLFMIAPERYRPTNFAEFTIADSTLFVTPEGSNYLDRVAEEADLAGGRAFITEYANSSDYLAGWYFESPDTAPLLKRGAFVTRLYTRISPDEMIVDPLFERAGFDTVDNNHDVAYVEKKSAGFSGTWFLLFGVFMLVAVLRTRFSRRRST